MVLDPEKAAIISMISPRFASAANCYVLRGRLLLACGDIQLGGPSIFLRVMLYEFAVFFCIYLQRPNGNRVHLMTV